MTRKFSRREIILRFSAHMAKFLNSDQATTDIADGHIYFHLIELLSGKSGSRAQDFLHLTGYNLFPDRFSAEEAADRYFHLVLQRRLFLARNNPAHKGHELFHALCLRCTAPGWKDSRLIRTNDQSAVALLRVPQEMEAVKKRLAALDQDISKGNPAASTRASQGPLYLELSGARIEIAEELPVWAAIECAPKQLASLQKTEWASFRNIVTQAVEVANAPYAAYLSVGLWPADWDGEISIHQIKQLSAFLAVVRQDASGQTPISAWREAWDEGHKVANFKTADDLWQSPLGVALRDGRAQKTVSLTFFENIDFEQEESDRLNDEAEFADLLGACLKAKVIDEVDVWLYTEIFKGSTAVELAQDAKMLDRLRTRRVSMAKYLEALQSRVHDFVAALSEIHPD